MINSRGHCWGKWVSGQRRETEPIIKNSLVQWIEILYLVVTNWMTRLGLAKSWPKQCYWTGWSQQMQSIELFQRFSSASFPKSTCRLLESKIHSNTLGEMILSISILKIQVILSTLPSLALMFPIQLDCNFISSKTRSFESTCICPRMGIVCAKSV